MQRALLHPSTSICCRPPSAQRSPQAPCVNSRSLSVRVAHSSRHARGSLVEHNSRGGWSRPSAAQAPPGMTVLAEAVVQLQGGAVTARLDQQLLELFPDHIASATAAKRALRRHDVLLNGQRGVTTSTVTSGDTVQLLTRLGGGKQWADTSNKPHLPLAYEDQHMAIVIKPQGLSTQGKGETSVQGRIKYCLQPTPLPGALYRPHHAHRLDAPTGGLLLVAKTRGALASLCTALTEHRVAKRYEALLIGQLEGCGMIDSPVDDKPAVTLFQVVSHHPSVTFGTLTWVSMWPKTGRRHQLRKHMAYMGTPILGDCKYKYHRRQQVSWQQLGSVEEYVPTPAQPAAAPAAAAAAAGGGGGGGGHESCHTGDVWLVAAAPAASTRAGSALHTGDQASAAQQQQQQLPSPGSLPTRTLTAAQDSRITAQPESSLQRSMSSSSTSSDQQIEYDHTAGSANTSGVEAQEASRGSTPAGDSDSTRSSSQVGELLRDGEVSPLCLWAVQLRLLHPVTGQHMDVSVGTQAEAVYQQVLRREAPTP